MNASRTRHARGAALGLALSLLVGGTAWAVMFASDTLHLVEDGAPITIDTVLVEHEGRLTVYPGGGLTVQQRAPYTYTFHQIPAAAGPVLDREAWVRTLADMPNDPDAAYQAYLRAWIDKAARSRALTLPAPTDKAVYHSPPPGETGGVIGSPRRIEIDLATGTVQVIESGPAGGPAPGASPADVAEGVGVMALPLFVILAAGACLLVVIAVLIGIVILRKTSEDEPR